MKKLFVIVGIVSIMCAAVQTASAQEKLRYEGFAVGGFLTNQYAPGEWGEQVALTLGAGADLEYTLPLVLPDSMALGFSEHLDYAHLFPKSGGNLKRGDDISLTFGTWLRIPFLLGTQNFAFQPEIGYSLVLHNIEGQNISSASGWYPDQALVISPALRWVPETESRSLEIELSPVYTAIFERDSVLSQIGFRLGGVWHLNGAVNSGSESSDKIEISLGIDESVLNDFTPDGDGTNDEVIIRSDTSRLTKPAEKWQLTIYDPAGNVFHKIKGRGGIPEEIKWNGYSDDGELVFSNASYKAVLTATLSKQDRKILGTRTAEGSADINTGTIMIKTEENTWRISVQIKTLVFDANAATFDSLTPAQKREIDRALDGVVAKAKAIEGYRVVVEGYANNVSDTQREHLEELLPLSQARAEAIAAMLVEKGLEQNRVTALGRGGENPIAEWKDQANWWKNRRIEFVITK
ncbi:MAG: OmpA family protein [Treponema sp.]|nr:OmpA family protein [Treponema sp.]